MRSLKLFALALVSAGLVAASPEAALARHHHVRPASRVHHLHHQVVARQPLKQAPKPLAQPVSAIGAYYAAGSLAGHPASDLYTDYIGYKSGVLPTQIRVDWHHQLSVLWQRKNNRSYGNKAVNDLSGKIVTEYRSKDPERMTIGQYTRIADQQAALMRQSTDWDRVADLYGLSDQQTNALRARSAGINGSVLVSYALTELMPGRNNGLFNAAYLDFLLRNAGRRYVESLPALHDSLTSFGPYQFTDQALYDVGGTRRGASKFNQAIRIGYRIPGSTTSLRGNDHFRAAYLFALNNMAETVRKMNKRQLATFGSPKASSGTQLAQSIAVAHNKPANGRRSELRWLSNHARLPYKVSLSGASRIYANKTATNYAALNVKPLRHKATKQE